ncbi:hypothetical protein FEM48_Zijuj01G0202900 [Ziziphus jujuba var. spinosa]|uniref:Uncharacterized protein n=1 Tax=Ziziphus jujuba var. spinosa TaxID=714518 RepID=A0A978W3C4_ZIZJJ|nr:hypothetical protein FEM48_Zijuj01G0202900 [Ziziphus jujuba var. spinosa]
MGMWGHLELLQREASIVTELSLERDTPNPGDELTEYGFLESPNKLFWLKFFNLEYSGSSNRYLGIQYMMHRSSDMKMKLQPRNHFLTSWLSPEFPALGEFTLGLDQNNTNQIAIWRKQNLYWRSGKWNGQNFSYFPAIFNDPAFKFSYISNENESYFVFTVPANYISSWI